MTYVENADTQWRAIYKLGGAAALGAVIIGVFEIAITFLPGGNAFVSFMADLNAMALTLAMFGGILSMVWNVLIARRLFQLAKKELDDNSAAQ